MLPRRAREVRVDRSSRCHLRHTREMELRVRVSVTKENILKRIKSGKSWKCTWLSAAILTWTLLVREKEWLWGGERNLNYCPIYSGKVGCTFKWKSFADEKKRFNHPKSPTGGDDEYIFYYVVQD